MAASIPLNLLRQWVEIGFQSADTVLKSGISRGAAAFWISGRLLNSTRYALSSLEMKLIPCVSLIRFHNAPFQNLKIFRSHQPARYCRGVAAKSGITGEVDEFHLPIVHPAHASLLDYLPRGSLVLVDDLQTVQTAGNEIEEQAVRLRSELIKEGVLAEDYPVPYMSWSELQDTLSGQAWQELGRSTAPETQFFGEAFQPGQRFGGRLKPFNEYVSTRLMNNARVMIVSRQASRLRDLWRERQQEAGITQSPEIIDGTLSDGWEMVSGNQLPFTDR